jgi:histidinol-phosphate phosphatase family protein
LILVFVDRDGTICKNVHYMRRPEQFELLPGVAEGIKLLNELGVKVIVATNQSGVARGYFTEADLAKIHERMIDELAKRGAKVDAVYYCIHHPDEECECRKPSIGMLKQAARDFGVNLDNNCFIIGDRKLDVEAGRKASCTSILVPTHETEPDIEADYVVTNFHEAAKLVADKIRG